jgi:hypothetical protein
LRAMLKKRGLEDDEIDPIIMRRTKDPTPPRPLGGAAADAAFAERILRLFTVSPHRFARNWPYFISIGKTEIPNVSRAANRAI